jgi:single-strand DNA-binding protein
MAGSINKVILLGNVGKDPEIRSTQDGRRIANFSIATSETWKDRASGERKERTTWHNIVVFNEHLVPIVEQYVKKGSKLYVEGAMQTRKWTDNQGQDRYTTEVVLAQYRGEIALLGDSHSNRPPAAGSADDYGQESARPGYSARHGLGAGVPQSGSGSDLDDDIPF